MPTHCLVFYVEQNAIVNRFYCILQILTTFLANIVFVFNHASLAAIFNKCWFEIKFSNSHHTNNEPTGISPWRELLDVVDVAIHCRVSVAESIRLSFSTVRCSQWQQREVTSRHWVKIRTMTTKGSAITILSEDTQNDNKGKFQWHVNTISL